MLVYSCFDSSLSVDARGLVFGVEIAAQADAHPTEARFKAAGNLGEAPRQPAISGKHLGNPRKAKA